MSKHNRRRFLSTTAAGTLGLSTLANAQDKTLKAGLIGAGWYGMVDVKAAFKVGGVEIVAICDVDSEHLQNNANQIEKEQGTRPQTYKHYQELLEQSGMDFVIIATPPHWHALPFIAACEKGLDIYCEKPLAYDVREGRTMIQAAQKAGNIVQIGFQRRQSQAIQQAKQFIQSGQAGDIMQVEAQIHYNAGVKKEDTIVQDPPESLDWDLWCGPAPKLPYCPQVGHFKWRLEKTTGHGHLVDWGIHLIDATRMILEESTPKAIVAGGGLYYYDGLITTPDTLTVNFEFERCPVVWRHRIWGSAEYTPEINNGIFFYGTKATVFVSDNRWVVIPRGNNGERKETNIRTDAGKEHMADFLQAVRAKKQPSCPIKDGFQSTTTVQLGMIAYESQSRVVWNAEREQITSSEKAYALLKRPYRSPWKHPYGDSQREG